MALTDADLPKLVELLNQIQIRMQQRRRAAADWAAANEVLRDGELGIETDTGRGKIGNGTASWNDRKYQLIGDIDLGALVDGSMLAFDLGAGCWRAVPAPSGTGGGMAAADDPRRALIDGLAQPVRATAYGEVTIGAKTYLVPLLERDGQAPDPYWANVVILLHFSDAVVPTLDATTRIWALSGTLPISASAGSPAGAAAQFNNSAYLSSAVPILLGTDDFTFEAWVSGSFPSGTLPLVASYYAASNRRAWEFQTNGYAPQMALSTDGTTGSGKFVLIQGPTFSAQAWHHIAAVRSSGVVTVYTDGVGGTPTSFPGSIYANTTDPVFVGVDGASTSLGTRYTQALADLRVTVGVARYTANFTPPTLPFPSYG